MIRYDLEKDPHEMNNAYHDPAYTLVIQELKAELLRTKGPGRRHR